MYKKNSMKLILFLIIVAIVYFIATQINVVHMDTFPKQQQSELDNKSKIRSMLLSNYIKCDNKDNNNESSDTIYQKNKETFSQISDISSMSKTSPPNGNSLLQKINLEYVDCQYKFNISNQPVTTRYPNKNTEHIDKKYTKHIKNNIEEWNEIFKKNWNKKLLHIRSVILLFIMETPNEFLIKANVKLLYLNKTLHLQLTYYGQVEKSDDFFNVGSDIYILQLVEILPLSKKEFNISIKSLNEDNFDSFMSMQEQMQYVDKINKMHLNETDY
jgi:hypothetical protein